MGYHYLGQLHHTSDSRAEKNLRKPEDTLNMDTPEKCLRYHMEALFKTFEHLGHVTMLADLFIVRYNALTGEYAGLEVVLPAGTYRNMDEVKKALQSCRLSKIGLLMDD